LCYIYYCIFLQNKTSHKAPIVKQSNLIYISNLILWIKETSVASHPKYILTISIRTFFQFCKLLGLCRWFVMIDNWRLTATLGHMVERIGAIIGLRVIDYDYESCCFVRTRPTFWISCWNTNVQETFKPLYDINCFNIYEIKIHQRAKEQVMQLSWMYRYL